MNDQTQVPAQGFVRKAIAFLGGRKFVSVLAGIATLIGREYFGISDEAMGWIVGLIATYVLAEGGIDAAGAFTRGKLEVTEIVGAEAVLQPAKPAGVDASKPFDASRFGMLLLFAVLSLGLTGCWGTSREANRAVESMEASAVNFAKNRDKIDEGFLQLYREQAQEKANDLAAAALKAEVKPDGTANAKNLQLILEKKAAHYASIEAQIIEMRKKIMQADPDMLNLLEYSKGLRGYFAHRTSTGELLNASGEQAIGMLTAFLGKKKE